MKGWLLGGLAVLMFATVPSQAQAQGKRIQCWTDKNGQRMCGDRVPPEYAGEEREIMKDGRVVDTVKGALTPEEIAEQERKKQAEEEAKRRAEYDRALLQTYRSAKDIEAMRDERLAFIDGRLRAAEKNAADTEKSLADLRSRAEADQKAEKPVNERLAKQIGQYEKAQKDNERALANLKREREETQQKFDRDITRFNELRGVTPAAAKSGG